MTPLNKAFISTVNNARSEFNALLRQAKIDKIVYPSKHFFERVVERDIDVIDVFRMIVPVVQEFRNSTYTERTIAVHWKEHTLVSLFGVGCVTEKRKIILRTVYDKNNTDIFDVEIKI